MMSHSFAPSFYMPEGTDTYDVAPCGHDYPTTLAEAILGLEPAEFKDLCDRAGVYPDGELAWHECMTWVTEEVNACTCESKCTRVYTGKDYWDSVDVYDVEYSARLVSGEEEE